MSVTKENIVSFNPDIINFYNDVVNKILPTTIYYCPLSSVVAGDMSSVGELDMDVSRENI